MKIQPLVLYQNVYFHYFSQKIKEKELRAITLQVAKLKKVKFCKRNIEKIHNFIAHQNFFFIILVALIDRADYRL